MEIKIQHSGDKNCFVQEEKNVTGRLNRLLKYMRFAMQETELETKVY